MIQDFFAGIEAVAAYIILAGGVVGAISIMISKSETYKLYRMKQRLATCPNRAVALHSLGGQIFIMCDRALYKGYMTGLQRKYLLESFEIYENAGGNGSVKDIVEQTKKLPIHEDDAVQ